MVWISLPKNGSEGVVPTHGFQVIPSKQASLGERTPSTESKLPHTYNFAFNVVIDLMIPDPSRVEKCDDSRTHALPVQCINTALPSAYK